MEALEFFYAHAIAQLLASGLVFAAAATALGFLGPWLLLAVVPAALLLLWSPLLEARGRAERGARTRAALAELSAESVESVDGLRELLMAGALDRTRSRLRSGGRRLARAQRAEQSWETGAGAARDLLVVAAVIGVVAAAAHAAGGGGSTGRGPRRPWPSPSGPWPRWPNRRPRWAGRAASAPPPPGSARP